MFRKIYFATLAICLAVPTLTHTDVATRKCHEELQDLHIEQHALSNKPLPHLRGLFVAERTEMLSTNRQVQLLLMELKKTLTESRLVVAKTQHDLTELIQAITYLVYTISAVVCIFGAVYLVKNIR